MMGRPPRFQWEEETELGMKQENVKQCCGPLVGVQVRFTVCSGQRRELEGQVLAWGQGNTVLVGTSPNKYWVPANQKVLFQELP